MENKQVFLFNYNRFSFALRENKYPFFQYHLTKSFNFILKYLYLNKLKKYRITSLNPEQKFNLMPLLIKNASRPNTGTHGGTLPDVVSGLKGKCG